MAVYDLEIIFEPTGDYVNITGWESDARTEEELHAEVIHELSIVSWKKED